MYQRDYRKENVRNAEINDMIRFKLDKETSKKFKTKLAEEGKTISEFLKNCVNEYINK